MYKNLTHLILDEVHEREKFTDFLLIGIKDAIRDHPNLKIILMSATINSLHFSQYFDNCPIIDIPGQCFEVQTIYLGDLLLKTEYKTADMVDYMSNFDNYTELSRSSFASIDFYEKVGE